MGGKVVFQMGSFIFKWREWCSMEDISFDGRFFKKYCRMGASGPMLLLVSSIKINLLLIDPEMLTSGSSKAKLVAKNFT